MQDNHAHPVAPNLKEEKKTVSDTVLRQKLLIVTLSYPVSAQVFPGSTGGCCPVNKHA